MFVGCSICAGNPFKPDTVGVAVLELPYSRSRIRTQTAYVCESCRLARKDEYEELVKKAKGVKILEPNGEYKNVKQRGGRVGRESR
jgi:hypothetical protein